MATYTLIATTAFGLEAVVKRELSLLGCEHLVTHNGYIEFSGDERMILWTNLWLRSADRVLMKVGEFNALTFDDLFEQTKALPWADILPLEANFPVEGRSVDSQLSSVPACQKIVKKAIVENLKSKHALETFPETGPRFAIEVALHKNVALLTIDTSGVALHKRGYRTQNAVAPIKETLAAALIMLSRWEPHRPFADPMCGSGTIAIEAAMIGRNIAPGLKRSFTFESWGWLDAKQIADVRGEAKSLETNVDLRIVASDVDVEVLELAEQHAENAGVVDDIVIRKQDVGAFSPDEPYGCIVTNPPYGQRLGETDEIDGLYRKMGRTFVKHDTWSIFVITSHPKFEKLYGRPADKKRKLYNGRIQTNFYQYLGPLPPRKPKAE